MNQLDKNKAVMRSKCDYRCVMCTERNLSVVVHHIVPSKDGGSDDLDNLVCLCPNCHSDYGDNPEKRTRIREMKADFLGKMENRNCGDEKLVSDFSKTVDVGFDNQKRFIIDKLKESIEKVSDAVNARDIVTSSGLGLSSAVATLGDSLVTYGNCQNCSNPIQLSGEQSPSFCPYCGKPIVQ